MKNHDHTDLDTSLKRLGIRELEERMEVAPLLADMGSTGDDMTQGSDLDMCCVCKIEAPVDSEGNLPTPTDDSSGGVPDGAVDEAPVGVHGQEAVERPGGSDAPAGLLATTAETSNEAVGKTE